MNVEMNITTIREYQPTDKNAVIDLIRQNTPAYFAPKEEADFSNYLDLSLIHISEPTRPY